MQPQRGITIYHVSKRDGAPLFLHPFTKRGSTMEVTASVELTGQYGEEPRVESITMLRNELYRRVEEDVRDWINERRFIPRFLIAAAAFLVVYLFLAAVVRDPLPVLDETIAALIVAIVVFVVIGRRFEQSKGASQRRVMLRSKIDGVVFSETRFVRRLEALLHSIEERNPVEAVTADPPQEARSLWTEHRDDTATVLEYLRALVATSDYRRLDRAIKRGEIPRSLIDRAERGEISPAAVVLLHILRQSA